MATDYPLRITTDDGITSVTGMADFTDPDNQPAAVNQPFKPASGEAVTVVENADGDDVLDYNDDDDRINVNTALKVTGLATLQGGLSAPGAVQLGIGGQTLIGGGPTDQLAFYGAGGVTQPDVPATPLPQDIVDALVALGLVSQSD